MAEPSVSSVKKRTTQLIDFLVEVTEAAERAPELDIFKTDEYQPWKVLWIEEIPTDAGAVDLVSDGDLFAIRPPLLAAQPQPSDLLAPWLERCGDLEDPCLRQVEGEGPESLGTDGDVWSADRVGPPQDVLLEFDQWLPQWRAWAQEHARALGRRKVYEFLEAAARLVDQRDDEYELVLARGFVRWSGLDGRTRRRHLVTEQVLPLLRKGTAEVAVKRIGVALRYEDSQLFGEIDGYRHDRAEDVRIGLSAAFEQRAPDDHCHQLLSEWVSRCLGVEVQAPPSPSLSHLREPGTSPAVSISPAFILRPRSKVMLAEAYKRISREMRAPETPLPVALAQLVVDTEPEQRQRWIELQHGVAGDVLGDDPRFPLDANPEQERIMELLRTETGVVVQGPPGTGKTHTIANLMCALLARGQRVLVTSQKDQALRVLREKIPAELRQLCVLLAGGSRDASAELEQGLSSLSEAVATSDRAALRRKAEAYAAERVQLRSRATVLNAQIRDLRDTESKHHDPVAPWFDQEAYAGSLGDIVRQVKRLESVHGWFPSPGTEACVGPPPLKALDLQWLRKLLISDTPGRRARMGQWIPEPGQVPGAGEFDRLVRAERAAEASARAADTPVSRQLATVGPERLAQLGQLRGHVSSLLVTLGIDEFGQPRSGQEWTARAINDLFIGQNEGLWNTLFAHRDAASRIESEIRVKQAVHVVEVKNPIQENLGTANGALLAGRELSRFLRSGGKLKSFLPGKEQRSAATFLAMVEVNGRPPTDLAAVEAAISHLEAEVAVVKLTEHWADCRVIIPAGRIRATLSQLADYEKRLETIGALLRVRHQVRAICRTARPSLLFHSFPSMLALLDAVPAALARLHYLESHAALQAVHASVSVMAERAATCPEIAGLLAAIQERDTQGYEQLLGNLDAARKEQAQADLLKRYSQLLGEAHPPLLSMLTRSAAEQDWDDRLPHLAEAWAWHQAARFIDSQRSAEREHDLMDEYTRLEDEVQHVTAQLAAAEAMLACLERMRDDHARALRAYREHVVSIGAGSGKRARDYRRAARAAMEKAKTAVPAWVVPLPNLLDNLPAERNSFDVVIVDEASQVGMEQLFLLWMAPRVIVVGDNKQCTPGDSRFGPKGYERVFHALSRHLGDADDDIQKLFTPKTDLYGLLSARSGKDSVIRLREHFRCVPEIINWSSTQFYLVNGVPGLTPLRERNVGDLPPLITRHVEGAYTDGRDRAVNNPVEAKAMAEALAACINDPRYSGKTFGMVVLQGWGQVNLLEREINARISPEEREARKIRVGVPSDFQGDEGDVVFLSLVVARPPRAKKWTQDQQAFNVAVSRAKDQLWLFTSVTMDQLKPDDLRASLLGYMQQPPSVYGASPALDEVSGTSRCTPFESLLEQRVFREIRGRGYHVVPQYPVGQRRLDLVVAGDGARVGVECDGDYYHSSPEQVSSDARRDRDLRRMKWTVIHIRESEFEFDRDRALAPLWTVLQKRGITPSEPTVPEQPRQTAWSPVPLEDNDENGRLQEDGSSE